ncbi:MAG TPA: hypothetical protein O0W86_02110 [Methanocorpusculum sp.]|nr:hypothetical protein [Methanocorpusculum sp.]
MDFAFSDSIRARDAFSFMDFHENNLLKNPAELTAEMSSDTFDCPFMNIRFFGDGIRVSFSGRE